MEIVAIVFGVLIIAVGLYFLLAPYEKLVESMPKKKSRRNVRVRGGVILACGVLLVILQVAMMLME